MKKIIFSSALVLATSLAMVSCDNGLDLEAKSRLSGSNFPKTDDDAIALANGMYQLQVAESSAFGYMTDLTTEHEVSGESSNSGGGLLSLMNWEPSNSYSVRIWTALFKTIAASNDVLDKVSDNAGISEKIRQRVTGEAYFFRAYSYNYAVQFWGEVPKVLHNTEASGLYRQPIDTIYNLIVSDLEKAIERLPLVTEYSSSDKGRASKGAAYTLLSKAYLTWAQTSDTDTDEQRKEKFRKSLEYAKKVTGYELEEDFLANWDNGNRNGKESVFAIQHIMGIGSDASGGNHLTHCSFNSGFTQTRPHVRPSSWKYYDAYEDGDQRKDGSIAKTLYNPATGEYYTFEEPRFRKYIATDDPLGSASNRDINRTVFRYSEVLLLIAEAANEYNGGPTEEAYEAINQVRRRAFKSFPVTLKSEHDLPAGLDYEGFKQALIQEREFELLYEQKHWLDLVRWRILVKTLKNCGLDYDEYHKQDVSLKNYRFPIPQSQRDINPVGLWQNWGYDGYDASITGENPYVNRF